MRVLSSEYVWIGANLGLNLTMPITTVFNTKYKFDKTPILLELVFFEQKMKVQKSLNFRHGRRTERKES